VRHAPDTLGYPAALDTEMILVLTLRRVVTTLLRLSPTRIVILGTHVCWARVEAKPEGREGGSGRGGPMAELLKKCHSCLCKLS
jgi:hypothetical protein